MQKWGSAGTASALAMSSHTQLEWDNENFQELQNHSLHLNMAQTGLVRLEKMAFFKLEFWNIK